jgi:hypothetical protein
MLTLTISTAHHLTSLYPSRSHPLYHYLSLNFQITRSSARIDMALPSHDAFSTSQIQKIENVTSIYLRSLLEGQVLRKSDTLVDFYVAITEDKNKLNQSLLHGVATSVTITQQILPPLNLTLAALTEQDGLIGLQHALIDNKVVSNTTVLKDIQLVFPAFTTDDADMSDLVVDSADASSDKSLLISCILLACALFSISTVLLYVTGGWSACRQSCTSCLFEEVDDEYAVAKMSTFQIQSYDGDRSDKDAEVQSVVTDNPDGMLGGRLAGLGIQTPMRRGHYEDGDSLTPMSELQTPVPLGIQSMRKLPPPESPGIQGGLSHMIMKRLKAPSQNNKQ